MGLERRDYRTLAQAVSGLDVDIRISGFSYHAAAMARSFPDPMPANMSCRFYSWPDLVQLYRDADVVVAPVFPSRYAAGVTTAPGRDGVPASRGGDPLTGPLRLPASRRAA